MDERIRNLIGSGYRIVDLGCGSGKILSDLVDQFEERIGLDVSRTRIKDVGNAINYIYHEADLNLQFPLEDEFADAIIANQVIEHIIDPLNFACEIHRILRPGGRLVVTTPNIRYFKHVLHLLFSGYGIRTAGGNTIDGHWDDGHLHYFTHKDLLEIFSQAGFSKIQSLSLINKPHKNILRQLLDLWSSKYPVREFFSGCILLWAVK